MFELTPRLVFLIVLVGGIAAFLWWDREKIERHYFIFFRRTAHGIDFIDRISRRFPRFWNYYGWAGVVTGFLSVAVAAVLITRTIGKMVVTRSVENGPSLVLPGLVSQNQFQAGVSFVPIEYWVIGVGILMVVHEMSHGIVARAEDFELNSVGWIIVGILPGAFVEPKGENMLPGDEENIDPDTGMWEQGTWKQRLKVLGAGSFANYLTAALFMGLAFGATTVATQPSDVFYMAEEGYPAHDSGMRNGTLVRIDGHRIDSVADLQNASSGIEVNETVPIWTSEGNFTVTATSKEDWEGGYIGIRAGRLRVLEPGLQEYQAGIQWFMSLLWTVGVLNLLIGLFNMLPLKPLDGGLMVETVLQEKAEDKMKYLDTVSLAGWAVLMGSIVLAIAAGAI